MEGPSPWWSPARHRDRRPRLVLRQEIMSAIRRYFEADGFIETACGALQVSPGNETHLHGLEVAGIGPEGQGRAYLHTSPEFAMKKLLAAGETKLFEFARVFRGREAGPINAPEFTMLEWYRAGESYEAVIADAIAIVKLAADAAGTQVLKHRAARASAVAAPERLTLARAFEGYAGIDLAATLSREGAGDRDTLAAQAARAGIKTGPQDTWSDIFSRVLSERIEPKLGQGAVTVLESYPRPEAALARASRSDARFAERFEIYVAGVELCNGFAELTDAREQRTRFEADMAEKERIYGARSPIDEEFLAALEQMPAAAGVALGFDRLAMLAAGANMIDDVMWTPPPRVAR